MVYVGRVGLDMERDYKGFEEKLKKASNEMVVSAIVKCVAEIVLLKEQIAKLEKRIEALEGKA
jgi:ubiquinone biosynthesis protein UbiJ